jgi:hypothetical protein
MIILLKALFGREAFHTESQYVDFNLLTTHPFALIISLYVCMHAGHTLEPPPPKMPRPRRNTSSDSNKFDSNGSLQPHPSRAPSSQAVDFA